jgi:hypothetical protein
MSSARTIRKVARENWKRMRTPMKQAVLRAAVESVTVTPAPARGSRFSAERQAPQLDLSPLTRSLSLSTAWRARANSTIRPAYTRRAGGGTTSEAVADFRGPSDVPRA